VVIDDLEVRAAQMLDVVQRARVEVMNADKPKPPADQVIAEMRPEETGPAGDDRGGHRADSTLGLRGQPQTLRPLYKPKTSPLERPSGAPSRKHDELGGLLGGNVVGVQNEVVMRRLLAVDAVETHEVVGACGVLLLLRLFGLPRVEAPRSGDSVRA